MALQNQFYPQPVNQYYPQYQNFQAQQRQEQLNQVFANSYNYIFARDRAEAEGWPIAPGNTLIFRDQNGNYFYSKSLGFGPNEKPVFISYRREDFVEQSQESGTIEQNPLTEQLEKYKSSTDLEIANLRSTIEELKEMFKQDSKPNRFDKNFKKRGGNES